MNKTVRLLSVLIAFIIALVFQLAASVESNRREWALKEEAVDTLQNILREEDEDRRVAILKNSGGQESLLYIDEGEKILFSNLSPEIENSLLTLASKNDQKERWQLKSDTSLEKKYIERTEFSDGSYLLMSMTQDLSLIHISEPTRRPG